jgi:hypothetical protein
VSLQIPEAGKINLVLRVPVPVRRRGRVEQEIVRRFLRECPVLETPAGGGDAEGPLA